MFLSSCRLKHRNQRGHLVWHSSPGSCMLVVGTSEIMPLGNRRQAAHLQIVENIVGLAGYCGQISVVYTGDRWPLLNVKNARCCRNVVRDVTDSNHYRENISAPASRRQFLAHFCAVCLQ